MAVCPIQLEQTFPAHPAGNKNTKKPAAFLDTGHVHSGK
jgi:hypothetical protein